MVSPGYIWNDTFLEQTQEDVTKKHVVSAGIGGLSNKIILNNLSGTEYHVVGQLLFENLVIHKLSVSYSYISYSDDLRL